MRFSVYQTSQIGGRKYNQDRVAYAYTDEALLLVLADGMGGHSHGEIAAQIAIQTFMQAFAKAAQPRISDAAEFLWGAMKLSHEAIIHYSGMNRLEGNPGTTCVAALVQEGEVTWAHAGDSRFYLLRDGKVLGVTSDHSVVQQLADAGVLSQDEMKIHPDRNKITNCLGGVEEMFYIEKSSPVKVRSGDVLLLCSDGLWSPLANNEIAETMAAGSLLRSLGKLVDIALLREQSRADNTTAVAVRLGENEDEHKVGAPKCVVLN